jgi:hypothetical protein
MSNYTITEEEKRLIIARLTSTKRPAIKLSFMTSDGLKTYSITDLVKSIENDEEMGKEYVHEQMEFLRRLANGDVYRLINQIENS